MKVVIAIDDSAYSQHLLDHVSRRVWATDTEFKIVHVLEPMQTTDLAGNGWIELEEEINKRRHSYAEKLCTEARHKLQNAVGGSIVHYEIREGSPHREIVFAASAWEANKILLGAHSRAICPHNSTGSVSRNVAERAICSVEIVRDQNAVSKKNTAVTSAHK